MTKDEITDWALANGWQMIDGFPSLTKPSAPHPAVVRLVLKATVASVEIKKPAGKWEKVSGESVARKRPSLTEPIEKQAWPGPRRKNKQS